MKADVGDFIVYRTGSTADNCFDYHGLVLDTNEDGVCISCGDSLDDATWGEIKDVIKGSDESRRLAAEYASN